MSLPFHSFFKRTSVRVPFDSFQSNGAVEHAVQKRHSVYKIIEWIKIDHNSETIQSNSTKINEKKTQPNRNGINDDDQEPNQMNRNEVNEEAWENLNEINLAKYLFDWNDWVETNMEFIIIDVSQWICCAWWESVRQNVFMLNQIDECRLAQSMCLFRINFHTVSSCQKLCVCVVLFSIRLARAECSVIKSLFFRCCFFIRLKWLIFARSLYCIFVNDVSNRKKHGTLSRKKCALYFHGEYSSVKYVHRFDSRKCGENFCISMVKSANSITLLNTNKQNLLKPETKNMDSFMCVNKRIFAPCMLLCV